MAKKAYKLLERMRASKSDWKQADIISLYKSFGFIITHGSSHDIIKHPGYPYLRTTLPRHHKLARVYVEAAVKIIDQLRKIETEQENGSLEES